MLPRTEPFRRLPAGAVIPAGWIRAQMRQDFDTYLGNLDALVPDLMHDPMYSTHRLSAASKAKDLGNLKSGDAAGDEQYKWWNSETQSNTHVGGNVIA